MNNADIFLQKYKELESMIKKYYRLQPNDPAAHYLSERTEFAYCREELNYCREVRNLLAHREKIDNEFPVLPSDEMIVFLEKTIEKLRNRKRCSRIMTPRSKIHCATLQDAINPAVYKMRRQGYTHLPILENNTVVGVFSQSSYFNYSADHVSSSIPKNLRFSDFSEYLALNRAGNEIFLFSSKNKFADELKDDFELEFRRGRRIVMVFVTENGLREENLLGLITPWDLLGHEF